MSYDLHRQLDQADFELRLRPSPETLLRKQRAAHELRESIRVGLELHEASKQFAAAFLKLQAIDYPAAFPTGETDFRCICGRLSRNGKYCGQCDFEV